jgi:hypothetical protein
LLSQSTKSTETTNMTKHLERQRLTLNEALLMDPEGWDDMCREWLIIDAAALEATVERWVWLRGRSAGDADAMAVRHECSADAGLLIALNLPAAEFCHWWRRHDGWHHFCALPEQEAGDEWAWSLLDRARAGADSLAGWLRAQVPIRPIKN